MKFFSCHRALSRDINHPDINFNDKLQKFILFISQWKISKQFLTNYMQVNFQLFISTAAEDKNIYNFRDFLLLLWADSMLLLSQNLGVTNLLMNIHYLTRKTIILYIKLRKRRGGGICIYILESIKFKVRNDKDLFNDVIRTAFVDIVNNKLKNVTLTSIYRFPKGNIELFKDIVKRVSINKRNSETLFIVGT